DSHDSRSSKGREKRPATRGNHAVRPVREYYAVELPLLTREVPERDGLPRADGEPSIYARDAIDRFCRGACLQRVVSLPTVFVGEQKESLYCPEAEAGFEWFWSGPGPFVVL